MSKWIKYLSVRPQTLKLFKENTAKTFPVMGMGKDMIKTPTAQKNNTKSWSIGLHEIEKCLHDKGKNWLEKKPTEWKKYVLTTYLIED